MIYLAAYLLLASCYAAAVCGHYDMGKGAHNWQAKLLIYMAMWVAEGLMWPFAFTIDLFRFFMPRKGSTVKVVNQFTPTSHQVTSEATQTEE